MQKLWSLYKSFWRFINVENKDRCGNGRRWSNDPSNQFFLFCGHLCYSEVDSLYKHLYIQPSVSVKRHRAVVFSSLFFSIMYMAKAACVWWGCFTRGLTVARWMTLVVVFWYFFGLVAHAVWLLNQSGQSNICHGSRVFLHTFALCSVNTVFRTVLN